jgi:hypothetical protein
MIYISISCFGYDKEIFNTIETAYAKAANPNNINIGISFTGNKPLYEEITNKYPNIKTKYCTYEENMGVGSGRLSALSMYENEEYFLQIDSHNNFLNNWDEYLINKFKEAQKVFMSDKVVFSGSLPIYEYFGTRVYYEEKLGYPLYEKNKFFFDVIPSFYSEDIDNLELVSEMVQKTGFAPLVKIHGFFMFGSKSLAKNLGIDKNIIFWEEEIIQSINLIDNGFILVYPGKYSPISHYHIRNKKSGNRESVFETYSNAIQLMIKNYYSYILDSKNINKIKKYKDYVGLDLTIGPEEDNLTPSKYSNISV